MDIQDFTREMIKEAGLGTALLTTLSRAGTRGAKATAKTVGRQLYGAGKGYLRQASKGVSQMRYAARYLKNNRAPGIRREMGLRSLYRGAKKTAPVVGAGLAAGYGAYKGIHG